MIAAGSLFTSCIEPVEPAGIYDLREAKARYYDALSKLRAADALLVEAKADLKKADAEYRRAEVEYKNLMNESQRLANEAQKLGNEKEAAKWAMKLEELKQQHELNMIDYQGKIAKAQETLRQILSEIEMAALDLTDAETAALKKAIKEYEKAYQAWTDAQEAVTAAESALWAAQYDMNNQRDDAGFFWDPLMDFYLEGIYTEYYYLRTGQTTPEYYESVIEYATMYAAYYAQLIATFEADPDVTAWAEELTELKEELDQVKYNRYQVTKDSVYYMANVYHDGAPAYKKAVEDWLEANNIRVESDQTQYKVGDDWITMNKPIAPGEKGFDPYAYYGDEVEWKEGGKMMGIPALEEDGGVAYLKFNYILDDYFTQLSEAGDGTKNFMELDGNDLIITANQMMKEFILGGETETPFKYKNADGSTVTAKYGLEGVYSVLERDLVLTDNPEETPEYLDSVRTAKYDIWKGHRDTLEKGMTAYKPYVDSLAKVTAAVADTVAKANAVKEAKKAAETGAGSLVKASQEIIATLNGIVKHSDLSVPDSQEVVKAVVKFAQARKAYLDYNPKTNYEGVDSNYFYFARSTYPTVIKDSIAFEDLTYEKLADKNEGKIYYEYKADGTQVTGKVPGIKNILEQLLGPAFSAAIQSETSVKVSDLNFIAFYKAYQYVEVDKNGKKVAFDDPAAVGAKIVAGTAAIAVGDEVTPYTPKAVQQAEQALALSKAKEAAAEANLQKAIDAFVAIYNKYWGETVDPSTVTAKNWAEKMPLKVTRYTLATFTDPYNLVTFTGSDIDYTNALGAVLVSVDPKSTDKEKCFENWVIKPQIFFGADGNTQTDFYAYMYAEYRYQMATAQTEAVLAAISAWIDDVKAAFKANEEYAEANYKATKENYDKYAALFKELTGKDAKNADDDAKAIVTTIGKPNKKYEAKGVKQTEETLYHWTGSWDLAGKQAEFAEQYIPEYPVKLAEWHTKAVAADHQIAHLEMIINELEDAYIAAIAVAEGDATIPTDYDTVEEYLDDLIEDTIDEYTYYMEMFLMIAQTYEEALAKYNAGYDPKQINIEVLEHALENAQLKLQDATIKLEVAEAYYNKVMTAILGKN